MVRLRTQYDRNVATAIAILLLRSKLPRFVLWSYLVLYVIGFVAYFPFRMIPD